MLSGQAISGQAISMRMPRVQAMSVQGTRVSIAAQVGAARVVLAA